MRASSSGRWRSRRRPDRWVEPGHLDRPEGRAATHGPRSAPSPRSTTTSACCSPDRHPALSQRPRHRAPERAADRGPGAGAARGHALARPRAAHQGSQDRGRPHRRRCPPPGLRPCPRRRELYDIADAPKLDKYKRHSIEVVVDRYVVRHAEAPEDAERADDGRPIDPETGQVIPDPTPRGWPIRSRPHCGSARGSSSSRRRRATTSRPRSMSSATARSTAARMTASRSTSSSRGTSRSTRPHGACPTARASGRSSRSTRRCSSRTRTRASDRAPSASAACCRPMPRGG